MKLSEAGRLQPGELRGAPGPAVSPDSLLQDLVVECQIGNRSPKPGVLPLQLLQTFHLSCLQATVPSAPSVVLRDPDPFAGLGHALAPARAISTSRSLVMTCSGVGLLRAICPPFFSPDSWHPTSTGSAGQHARLLPGNDRSHYIAPGWVGTGIAVGRYHDMRCVVG